jgi:hypothetical protein
VRGHVADAATLILLKIPEAITPRNRLIIGVPPRPLGETPGRHLPLLHRPTPPPARPAGWPGPFMGLLPVYQE